MADRVRTVNDLYATVRKSPPHITDITWDDKPKQLKDLMILCRDRLPFVARVHKGTITSYIPGWRSDSSDSRSDSEDELDNILHVLEFKCRKIIIVRRMQWNRQQAEYQPSDKKIELPITYKGWFEVLPEDGRAVEYFDSIQSIANVKPRKFLVRTSIVGYQLCNENGTSCWQPLEIKPGEVLTTGIVYMDQKKGKSTMRTFFKRILKSSKNNKKDQELKYLQCFNNDGKEVMIPLIMTGLFSPVGDVSSCNYDAVYEIQDLVMAFKLPVKAQLIQDIEQDNQNIVPNGMIILEDVQDEDVVTVAKFTSNTENAPCYEIPINADLKLVKGMTKSKKSSRHSYKVENAFFPQNEQPKSSDQNESLIDPLYANVTSDPMLPTRVKERKKSTGSGILDKLSVRSKSKKERANIKALQREGVFSSRLSKSDMNLEEFFHIEDEEDNSINSHKKSDPKYVSHFDSLDQSSDNHNSSSALYGVMRQPSTQNRDLPPVPNDASSPKVIKYSDAVYEELPIAPKPPSLTHHNKLYGTHGDEEDGYMCPAQLKEVKLRSENPYGTTNVIRTKPPLAPKENAKLIRARRARSEMVANIPAESDYNSNQIINYSDNQSYSSPYQATALAESRRKGSFDERIFSDDLGLETRSNVDWNRVKSRSHKNLNFTANATVRSHNRRQIRNVMDMFNYTDSINDLRQSKEALNLLVPRDYASDYNENEGLQESRSFPSEYARPNPYVMSPEPEMRRYPRAMSTSGFSDIYRGNDSAISGDYGFHGDSEFSYSEYSEYIDDGWSPPNELNGLTVQEVSKSMRYIGMKDRVVIRLANEQIDGKLLCSLDKKLLREGFPELNALEVKKIVDFINGWRPKKK